MRHPHWKKFPVHTYSHHQKTVVLDYGTKHVQVHILSHARTRMHARPLTTCTAGRRNAQALLGGIDLCLGRWDDKDHHVVDDNHINKLHPGKDYINPEVSLPALLAAVSSARALRLSYEAGTSRAQTHECRWRDR
jgi:hypothetical protein